MAPELVGRLPACVRAVARASPPGATEYDVLNAAIAGLRLLASTLDCSVLGIAEQNRNSIKTGGLHASAGSRKFEYGAEVVFDLRREEDARDDAHGRVPLTLTLVKNRHGAAGRTINLRFSGRFQSFEEA